LSNQRCKKTLVFKKPNLVDFFWFYWVWGRYFPSVRMEIYVLKVLFSVPRDEKVSKPEAIFCPPRTKKKTMRILFSIHANGNLCAQSDCNFCCLFA